MSTASKELLSAFKTECAKAGVADTIDADFHIVGADFESLTTRIQDLYCFNPSVADIAYKDPFNIDNVYSALLFVGLGTASDEFVFSSLGDDPDTLIDKALRVLPLNANGAASLDDSSKCMRFLSSDEDNLLIAQLANLWGVHTLTAFEIVVRFAVLCNTLSFCDLEYYVASMTWVLWFEMSRGSEVGADQFEMGKRIGVAGKKFCEVGVLDDITGLKLSLLMLLC